MRRTFGAWRDGRAVANLRPAELSLADPDSHRWWRNRGVASSEPALALRCGRARRRASVAVRSGDRPRRRRQAGAADGLDRTANCDLG